MRARLRVQRGPAVAVVRVRLRLQQRRIELRERREFPTRLRAELFPGARRVDLAHARVLRDDLREVRARVRLCALRLVRHVLLGRRVRGDRRVLLGHCESFES